MKALHNRRAFSILTHICYIYLKNNMKRILTFLILICSLGVQAQKVPTLPPRTNGTTFPKDSSLAIGYALIPVYTAPSFAGYTDRPGTNFGLRSSNNRLNVRGSGAWLEFPSYTEVQSMIAAVPAGVTSAFGRTGAVTAQSGDYSAFYYPLTGNPSGFLTSVPSLQQVTNVGSTTTNGITSSGNLSSRTGLTGNGTSITPAGLNYIGSAVSTLAPTDAGIANTWNLPSTSGTIALVSQIPSNTAYIQNQQAVDQAATIRITGFSAIGGTGNFTGTLQSVGFQSTYGNFTSNNSLGLGPNVSALKTTNVTAQRSWEMPNSSGTVALLETVPFRALTTTGTSGPATLIGGTLNIPQYPPSTYSFSNGLSNSSGSVTLGGDIVNATILTLTGTNNFNLSAGTGVSSSGFFNIGAGSGSLNIIGYATGGSGRSISFSNSQTVVRDDINSKWMEYATDYSVNSTNPRSIPDLAYVNSLVPQIVEVAGTTQSLSAARTYILHGASLTTCTLPVSANVGDLISIIGEGSGGFRVAQNASQFIVSGNATSTTGTGGYIQSTTNNTFVSLRYVATNKWMVTSSNSAITIN